MIQKQKRLPEVITFSSEDKATAKMMLPFLNAAMERAISLKRSRELETAIQAVTPDLPYEGMLILTQSLTPEYYDEGADVILNRLHQSDRQHSSFPENLPEELHHAVGQFSSEIESQNPKEIPCTEVTFSTEEDTKPVTAQLRVFLNDNNPPRILVCFNPTNKPMKSDATLRKMDVKNRTALVFKLMKTQS